MKTFFNKSIINVIAALMIVSFTSGCKDHQPAARVLAPVRQSSVAAEGLTIDRSEEARPAITVTMTPETAQLDSEQILVFGVRNTDSGDFTPVLGSYERTHRTLTFTPEFPLLPNQSYLAINLITDESTSYRWQKSLGDPPTVKIFPHLAVLPANHLKFYLYFSTPMRQEAPWEHFQLLDLTTGDYVPRPFRHTELWNQDGDRLTLWFHPGRQKTGVNLNLEIGPILDPGHKYQLQLDRKWQSLSGAPIGKDITIRFTAGPADHSQPDPERWDMEIPQVNTTTALILRFGEPLDHALLNNRSIEVFLGDSLLESNHEVLQNGHGLRITPLHPWAEGSYTLQINPRLEDLAGNSIERPFEVDLNNKNADQSKAEQVTFTLQP